jgi:prephenate dehydrogenase
VTGDRKLKKTDNNMTITVIGIGLIGGSLSLDLRKRQFTDKIIGVDTNPQHRNIAQLCGIIDETDTLENAIGRSDLILLCTPVNANISMLPAILDMIKIIPAVAGTWLPTLWQEQSTRVRWLQ